jgi:hypothetical protein
MRAVPLRGWKFPNPADPVEEWPEVAVGDEGPDVGAESGWSPLNLDQVDDLRCFVVFVVQSQRLSYRSLGGGVRGGRGTGRDGTGRG